jgi:putative oxidoreductase
MGIGFLLLQLIVELILTSHGARKLFGWFGGPGRRHAPMAGLEETGGGLLLALALLTLPSGDRARYHHQSGDR